MGTATNVLMRLAKDPVNYWGGMMLDAVVAATLLTHASQVARRPLVSEAAVLLAGLGLYSLLEYAFHRWAYHHPRSPGTPGHRLHHDDPVAPLALPCFMTTTVELALWAVLRPVLGDAEASLLIAALVIGFLLYGLVHHVLHHGRPSWRYLVMLRAHHRIHHRLPDRNFGVTMTAWDWVFGTHYRLSARRMPARIATLPRRHPGR